MATLELPYDYRALARQLTARRRILARGRPFCTFAEKTRNNRPVAVLRQIYELDDLALVHHRTGARCGYPGCQWCPDEPGHRRIRPEPIS
jgi:hypothetical protein